MIPHQLVLAATDGRFEFHGRHFRVLIFLHTCLDWVEYRQVKLRVISTAARIDKSTASRVLDELGDWQFVAVGPADGRIHWYRLCMPRDNWLPVGNLNRDGGMPIAA